MVDFPSKQCCVLLRPCALIRSARMSRTRVTRIYGWQRVCRAKPSPGSSKRPGLRQDKQVPHGLTVSAILKRGVNRRCSSLLPPEGDLIHSTDSIQCGIVRHGRPVVCQPAGGHETDHENCVDNGRLRRMTGGRPGTRVVLTRVRGRMIEIGGTR